MQNLHENVNKVAMDVTAYYTVQTHVDNGRTKYLKPGRPRGVVAQQYLRCQGPVNDITDDRDIVLHNVQHR
jgi:hypothetical protein